MSDDARQIAPPVVLWEPDEDNPDHLSHPVELHMPPADAEASVDDAESDQAPDTAPEGVSAGRRPSSGQSDGLPGGRVGKQPGK